MTDQLSSLLHDRAAHVDFDPVDLDLLTSTGDRRIRQRRFAGLAVGVAAVAACSGLVVAVGSLGDDETRRPEPLEVPQLPPEPSFATGSTIHTPSGDVEVGHRVASYVRTRVGYVTADPQGRVWSVVDGEVEMVGQTDARDADLVVDAASSLVGYVDPTCSDKGFRCSVPPSPTLVVFDQETGLARDLAVDTSGMDVLDDEADPASFYALSRGVAYVRTHDGAVAIDVASGEQRVLDPDARNGFDILGAHDGTVAFRVDTADLDRVALGPTRAEADLTLDVEGAELVGFAPDGAHLFVNNDDLAVFDTATGARTDLALDADYSGGFDWLDDDTFVALRLDEGVNEDGEEGAATFTLLTCSVSAASCEPVALDVPNLDAAEGTGFAFPDGIDWSNG